jgi:hypothetical protein
MRNIKILGLAFVAMLAMSAVMAGAASADKLTATGYPANLTATADGEFVDEFKTTAGTVKCPEPVYHATIGAAIPTGGSVVATPTYPHVGCTGFGFPATIDMNECTYNFSVVTGTVGKADLECPTGKEVTVTASSGGILKCTVHVKTQTDLTGAVTYTNIAGGKITLEANLGGIDYTHTQGTGLGSCPSGSATNGTLVAKAIVSATSDDGKNTPTSVLLSA